MPFVCRYDWHRMPRMEWIYLDNNATTQPAPQVLAAMAQINEEIWPNPSSMHRFGQMARQRMELARTAVAQLLSARPREVVFTSGGTESNNLALRGTVGVALERCVAKLPPRIITSRIEHPAIREPVEHLEHLGAEVHDLPIDRAGRVDPSDLSAALDNPDGVGRLTLVSVQWVNNETGVIQPIEDLAAVCRRHDETSGGSPVLFHSDATQAVGKIPVDVKASCVDMLTLSGHKFHGPKGAAALYVRTGVRLRPQNLGGPQERDRRGGTENVAALVGLGVAADLARNFLKDQSAAQHLAGVRDRLETGLLGVVAGMVVNHDGTVPRLWNTTNIGFANLEAEAILVALSEKGLCVSAGSACSSGSLEPSPVLVAMGVPDYIAHGSVRFSISRFTTNSDINQALRIVPEVVKRLGMTLPLGQTAPSS